MKDMFEEKIGELEEYRWITIQECSEKMGISTRTLYKYLNEGKIKGVIYQRRRMIDSISVIGYLLEKKCLEINQIKNEEIKKQLNHSNW
jgi:predicted DNA-binding protein (UPF0251 family)